LPNQPFLDVIGHHFNVFESLESTNNYAMAAIHDGKAGHGYVYQALEQTAGKGQRGKTWISGRNMNLALSVVLEPSGIAPSDTFLLGAASAVAVCQWLNKYIPGCLIKWPNDIYIHDKKIAGILIENIIRGNKWNYAVAGIGVNINQQQFDEGLGNAISLSIVTGKKYELETMGRELCEWLELQWKTLGRHPEAVIELYNECLYRKNLPVRFRDKTRVFTAVVKYVTPSGELIVGAGSDEVVVPRGVQWLISS
jgi:BirA family transcriptional regulator, biotin operon repressor / biotin---[acetyl-CoA-carboxylase] ligase